MKTLTTKETYAGSPEALSAQSKAPLSVQFFNVSGGTVLDVPPPVCFHGPGPSVGKLQDQAFLIRSNVMSVAPLYNSICTHKHSFNTNIHIHAVVPASFPGWRAFLLHLLKHPNV